jgi:DNA-directed RNA polymerase specialized sigma24 family protein
MRAHLMSDVELRDAVPGPEEALEQHAMREWVWQALERLSPDERVTVMLRHFSRCSCRRAKPQPRSGGTFVDVVQSIQYRS